jgi:hypothetical protein
LFFKDKKRENQLLIKNLTKPKNFILIFFLFLFLTGLLIFKDYGIPWDEISQRSIGGMNAKYIATKFSLPLSEKTNAFPNLLGHGDKDHGPVFETLIFLLESALNISEEKTAYQLKHLSIFIIFLIATFSLFEVISIKTNNWKLGLLGASFFVLSPRFFAESFYNSKDIVFASLFAININLLIKFIRNLEKNNIILFSFFTAIAIDIRIMAIIFIAFAIFVMAIKLIYKQLKIRKALLGLFIYISLTTVFTILFYPYLWESPLTNFFNSLTSMSKFTWSAQVLYMGKYISALNLPWHYSIVWIFLTTPIFYILLFIATTFNTLKDIFLHRLSFLSNQDKLENLILLSLTCFPVAMVIVLKSTLYDGWRHLYFIYPSMIVLATLGWKVIFDKLNQFKMAGRFFLIFTIIYLLQIMIWMYKAHPLQNVFFNSFVKGDLRTKYELDYWGVGNILALNFIANIDKSPVIYIKPESQTPLEMSFMMLGKEDAKRFRMLNTEINVNYYAITNYRCLLNCPEKPIDIKTKELEYSSSLKLLKEIKVDNQTIISIYKNKDS